MARAGTLPENAYFKELTPISSNQGTNTNQQSVEEELKREKMMLMNRRTKFQSMKVRVMLKLPLVKKMMKGMWAV